jgi:hypothetical protein
MESSNVCFSSARTDQNFVPTITSVCQREFEFKLPPFIVARCTGTDTAEEGRVEISGGTGFQIEGRGGTYTIGGRKDGSATDAEQD